MKNGATFAGWPPVPTDLVSGRKAIEEDPRHVVRTLQRREVAGAWQG